MPLDATNQRTLRSETVRQDNYPLTAFPVMMFWAAIMMDFIPDAQTLLIVVQGVDDGRPEGNKAMTLSRNDVSQESVLKSWTLMSYQRGWRLE